LAASLPNGSPTSTNTSAATATSSEVSLDGIRVGQVVSPF
jgi:hypothetical protein